MMGPLLQSTIMYHTCGRQSQGEWAKRQKKELRDRLKKIVQTLLPSLRKGLQHTVQLIHFERYWTAPEKWLRVEVGFGRKIVKNAWIALS